jgi:hypothetical protein
LRQGRLIGGACSWRSSCQALPHFIQEVNDEKLLCPMIGSIRFTISQVCNSFNDTPQACRLLII